MNIIFSIVPLNETKVFSHEEAVGITPILRIITKKTLDRLSILNLRLSNCKNELNLSQTIQEEINETLQSWSGKVRRIGVIPVALAKVIIPTEETHYLWEYSDKKTTSFLLA